MTKLPGKGYGLSTSALTQTITDIIIRYMYVWYAHPIDNVYTINSYLDSSNFIDLKNLCIAKEQVKISLIVTFMFYNNMIPVILWYARKTKVLQVHH